MLESVILLVCVDFLVLKPYPHLQLVSKIGNYMVAEISDYSRRKRQPASVDRALLSVYPVIWDINVHDDSKSILSRLSYFYATGAVLQLNFATCITNPGCY